MKRLWLFPLCLLAISCAKSEKKRPAAPCGVGVNLKTCQLPVNDLSRWSRTIRVAKGGDGADKDLIVKKIFMVQEFNKGEKADELIWRRTSTVFQEDQEPQSMFIQGQGTVSVGQLNLTVEKSSCDGLDSSFHIEGSSPIYYSRYGGKLDLRGQPPIKIRSNGGGIGGLMAGIMSAAIGSVVQAMMGVIVDMTVQMMTLGTYRNQLASGYGDYRADLTGLDGVTKETFGYGKFGCLMRDQNQKEIFKPATVQALDW